MAIKLTKNECLELRRTHEQRRIIDQAVELRGGSLMDFVLGAAQETAMQTIREFRSSSYVILTAAGKLDVRFAGARRAGSCMLMPGLR